MGWKNFKTRFGIKHIVQVTEEGVCIGSSYVHNLVTVNPATGVVTVEGHWRRAMEQEYPDLLEASPEEIVALLQAPDAFDRSVTVYTYDRASIIEQQCETLGWPNVTHRGDLMFENTFSSDKKTVIEWAKRNAGARVECSEEHLADVRLRLQEAEARLEEARSDQARLDAEHPDVLLVQS